MTFDDLVIELRERILNFLSGIDGAQTLNPVRALQTKSIDGEPAADLIHLLQEVVSQEQGEHGEKVDYVALRTSSLYQEFHRCMAQLLTFDPGSLPDWESQLAFWINLYNTLILDGVIALSVQHSVIERRAGISFFRQAAYLVGGQRVSCDDIGHGVLRANRGHPFYPGRQFQPSDPRFKWVIEPFDARIHFALNCASRSCPPIRAYSPGKVESQLDLATRSFLAADSQIVPEENALVLSSIFRWFAADFGGQDGVIRFILEYLPEGPDQQWLSRERYRVRLRYSHYDWKLNSTMQPTQAT